MKEINVLVTGAAGQIGYALLPRLASGETFGSDVIVNLRLVEIPQVVEKLNGTIMELEDCGFNTLGKVEAFSDIYKAAEEVDWALLVGSIPRGITINGKKIEERGDLLKINGGIFTDQGKAIGSKGKNNAKILVVGNPANTNALIGMTHANNTSQTWMAMTALDANRAKAQVSSKINVPISEINQMIIWGNHSPTMYPDLDNALVKNESVSSIIKDEGWIKNDFLETVQQRGKAIIDARGASSAASAANAAIETVKATLTPTKNGDCFSAAILSDGSYDVPEGIIYGFPLRSTKEGKIEIIQGLEINSYAKEKLEITTRELLEEKEAVSELI
ncbi:MAG: malate dehydrogenase [Pseudomonadota bacterium]|nr:malate dehydrogenase [Pseudomonadota bacterium]MEC7465165.1 malate dehydrogenase [Pseudomonadota bacterium]MEC8107998.1 malate dehydrogenase [Pseudomonadota bacterium]MEC8377720.1 malate dehydrogenase [Pseudomonadota bacterium]